MSASFLQAAIWRFTTSHKVHILHHLLNGQWMATLLLSFQTVTACAHTHHGAARMTRSSHSWIKRLTISSVLQKKNTTSWRKKRRWLRILLRSPMTRKIKKIRKMTRKLKRRKTSLLNLMVLKIVSSVSLQCHHDSQEFLFQKMATNCSSWLLLKKVTTFGNSTSARNLLRFWRNSIWVEQR